MMMQPNSSQKEEDEERNDTIDFAASQWYSLNLNYKKHNLEWTFEVRNRDVIFPMPHICNHFPPVLATAATTTFNFP